MSPQEIIVRSDAARAWQYWQHIAARTMSGQAVAAQAAATAAASAAVASATAAPPRPAPSALEYGCVDWFDYGVEARDDLRLGV